MRALKIAGAAIAAVIVVIALLLVIGIPSSFLTSTIEARVERETGLKLAINGGAKIGLWPSFNVTLNDIALKDTKDRDINNRLTASRIQADMTLASVWSGRPEITELLIVRPVVTVPLQRVREANPPARTAPSNAAGGISVEHVSVVGGTLVMSNLRDRVESRIETINADATMGSDRKLTITGNARASGEPLKFEIKASPPAPPIERQNIPTELTFEAPGLLQAPLTAKAEVRLNGSVVMINGVSGTLNDGAFNGWASVDVASKPLVKLDLDFQRLAVAMSPGRGASGSQPWSNATIDFNGLNYVDAQARISAAEIGIGDGRFAPAALDATLASGVLKVQLANLGAYDGNANGDLTIDASTGNPVFALRTDLTNVRALFQDGAIRGLNVAQMIRSLTSSPLSGWQEGEALSTDLTQLSASFKIDKGQAQTTDLNLVGPLVRMTGAGTIDLGTRQIGFRVEPKLVMTTEGQGRAGDPVGFGIPVMIEGPWTEPRIYPDMQGILDNPDAAYARLKELGKGLFGPDGAGLGGLSGLLGGARNGTGAPGGNTTQGTANGQTGILGGQLGETIGNLLQQGLNGGFGQSGAARPSQPGSQPPSQGRSLAPPETAAQPAQPAPTPAPSDQAEQPDSQPMNDVLRQLFNR
jgi:AsmA protein